MRFHSISVVYIICLSLILPSFIPAVNALNDSWTTLASFPTARINFGTAVVDGKIFAIGGHSYTHQRLDINEMYDPSTDTWVKKAAMPTAREGFGIAVYENKIYVIGGATGVDPSGNGNALLTAVNEVYDPATDTWETKAPIPSLRQGVTACTSNGKIYVISGIEHTENSYRGLDYGSNKNEAYNPETNTWTTEPSIPNSVFGPVSIVVDDKIYVLGGTDARIALSGKTNYNQVYDTKNKTWALETPCPVGFERGAGGKTSGIDSKIYVFGGVTEYNYEGSNVTQIYNPKQDNWTIGSQMPSLHAWHGVAEFNNEFYIFGGYSENGKPWNSLTEKYTPADDVPIPEIPAIFLFIPTLTLVSAMVFVYYRKEIKELNR
jgi:N-acetylneuraminic acid mutarotase